MSIPEDVAAQLMDALRRIAELESDFEVAGELLDSRERQIRKLQMELAHAMGGALSGQLLELKALRRMLSALVIKYGSVGNYIVVTDLEMENLSPDAELEIKEEINSARTTLRVKNVPLIDRLRAARDKLVSWPHPQNYTFKP